MAHTLTKPESSPYRRLHAVATHFTNECVVIHLTCRSLLPEPHRHRMNQRLSTIAWRMSRYLTDSEAGTNSTPESICQARMIRLTMDNAAECYAQALNAMESTSQPVPQALIDNGRRLAALASMPIPTFPETLNHTTYCLEVEPGKSHTSFRGVTCTSHRKS